MAFVFRAERNIMNSLNTQVETNICANKEELNSNTLSQIKSQDNILKDPNLINNRYNNIFSLSPPFLTGAERNQYKKESNSPGPGTYNISKGYYNKHRQFSSRQENSKPEEYELFDLPLLRMKEVINDNPGPGYYNPSEKDLFGGKFTNKNKLLIKKNNNSSSNNEANIFKKEKNAITNSNSLEIDNNINKLIYIYSSKRRKGKKENMKKEENTEINKKKIDEYGGELTENFSMKNIKSPLTMKISDNNLGNNNSKISGVTLDTERTSINTSKLNYSYIRNKSSKLFQNLKSQSNNNNYEDQYFNNHLATDQTYKKNNTLFPILLKYDKSRIYKNEQNHDRLILFKSQNSNDFMNEMTEFDKLLNSEYFSKSPGPGYYDPIDSKQQKYSISKNNSNYLNEFRGKKVTSLIKNIKKTTPGPGYYMTDNNMINNMIIHNTNKKMRDILFDVKKIAKLRIMRENEALKKNKNIKKLKENYSLKPKNENNNNNSKEIFEEEPLEYRKMHSPSEFLFNFGSNDKRFNDNKNIKENYPGPGEYEAHLYKSIEEKNANITEVPSYKELYDKAENKNYLIERTSLNKDVINTPGVGEYNPDIITSIKYNFEHKNKMKPPIIHKSSFNPEVEKMTLLKAKEIKEKERKLISYLGPGRYINILNKAFNDMNKNLEKRKPPFGSSEKKSEPKKRELFPGPGQYDINSYYNWITRTYNTLFS